MPRYPRIFPFYIVVLTIALVAAEITEFDHILDEEDLRIRRQRQCPYDEAIPTETALRCYSNQLQATYEVKQIPGRMNQTDQTRALHRLMAFLEQGDCVGFSAQFSDYGVLNDPFGHGAVGKPNIRKRCEEWRTNGVISKLSFKVGDVVASSNSVASHAAAAFLLKNGCLKTMPYFAIIEFVRDELLYYAGFWDHEALLECNCETKTALTV